jgi:hypothetical protein
MSECSRCAEGHRRNDSTHDKGCPHRWVTFGEHFDELTYEQKQAHFRLFQEAGITKATTLQEYSNGLYRPKRTRERRKMSLDPHTATIQDGKAFLNANVAKGTNCPCCGQRVKLYKRYVTHRQAATLLLLHRTFPVGCVVDINNFIGRLDPALAVELLKGREWHKLKYWGLLEEFEVDKKTLKSYREAYPDMKGKKVAFHRLTQRGFDFVNGARIFKNVFVFDDEVKGWDEETTTTIQEALGEKFDFNQLSSVPAPALGHIIV